MLLRVRTYRMNLRLFACYVIVCGAFPNQPTNDSNFGTAGLVAASILGMSVRILVAFHLLSRWFSERMGVSVRPALLIWPQLPDWLAFVAAFAITRISAGWYASSALDFKALLLHVGVG